MIPRDWMLIKRGHDMAVQSGKPGADAPDRATVADLVARYG